MKSTEIPATRTSPTAAAGRRATALGALVALAVGALGLIQPVAADAAARQSLVGLFRLTAGSWSGSAHGTYFRMLQPDGKTYLTNTSSSAGNKSFTLLRAGTDGGLRTGAYQSTPNPAFAPSGDALSGKVTAPTNFFGIKFATATNKKDPQTGQQTALPVVYATGTSLSGNLSAFAASWNNQHFNQGSPKPNGTSPGFTRALSGTYNPSSRAFTLTWRSLIVGGPFNKFTGEWHLTGTFVPKAAAKSTSGTRTSAAPAAPAPKPATSSRTSTSATTHATTAPAPARTSASRSTARSASPSPKAATSTSRSSAAAAPAVSSSPVAADEAKAATTQPAAAGTSDSGTSPLLVGGGIVLVALLAGLAFWRVPALRRLSGR